VFGKAALLDERPIVVAGAVQGGDVETISVRQKANDYFERIPCMTSEYRERLRDTCHRRMNRGATRESGASRVEVCIYLLEASSLVAEAHAISSD
jgi:hypothetical protein